MAIPFFETPSLALGPIRLEAYGVMVAIGVIIGASVATRESVRRKLSPQVLSDFAIWGVVTGVVVGHLVHLFFYHPEELSKSPWQILRVWDGLSSMGGLVGGILAAVVFFRVKGLSFRAYADPLALAVSLAWGIARIGCFLAHDHPGVPTDFFLAMDYPGEAGPRHDLGLYDALALFSIHLVLRLLASKGKLKGLLLPALAMMYGTTRFFFDFLRATDLPYVDARYLGLTPAQFVCIGLWIYGLSEFARARRSASTASGVATG